jgi:hypothetical protein
MSIQLLITSQDENLERVLAFLESLPLTTGEKLHLIERTAKWLKVSEPYYYGFTRHPQEVSASLSLDGTEPRHSENFRTESLPVSGTAGGSSRHKSCK